MTDKPTPKEIENLFVEETGFDPDDFPAAIFDFARAVLAKWGSPVVAGEPVAVIEFTDGVKEPRIMSWNALPAGQHRVYTAPQPTHAQTGAVPLTAKQMESGRDAIFSTGNPYCPCDSKTFRKVAEWVERHHGITHKEGGQHVE